MVVDGRGMEGPVAGNMVLDPEAAASTMTLDELTDISKSGLFIVCNCRKTVRTRKVW